MRQSTGRGATKCNSQRKEGQHQAGTLIAQFELKLSERIDRRMHDSGEQPEQGIHEERNQQWPIPAKNRQGLSGNGETRQVKLKSWMGDRRFAHQN